MKKIYVFSLFIILILSIFASPVLAKDTQNNGKPFQDLWDAIKSLWDAINNIELTPGPVGPQGEPGPTGPEGTCSCPFTLEEYQSIVSRVGTLEMQVFGGIKWEGDIVEPWLHNNYQLDPTKTISRCGCPGKWNCPHDTLVTSDGNIITFDSGPKHGSRYQTDGMKFWLEDIAVVPGAEHEVEFDITDLDARVDGYFGPEPYQPRWTLYVIEDDTVLETLSEQWGTPRCNDCNPDPSSLGVRTLTFTPAQNNVDFYFIHSHGSSQCSSSAYNVKMALDYFYVTVAD